MRVLLHPFGRNAVAFRIKDQPEQARCDEAHSGNSRRHTLRRTLQSGKTQRAAADLILTAAHSEPPPAHHQAITLLSRAAFRAPHGANRTRPPYACTRRAARCECAGHLGMASIWPLAAPGPALTISAMQLQCPHTQAEPKNALQCEVTYGRAMRTTKHRCVVAKPKNALLQYGNMTIMCQVTVIYGNKRR